jgi:hypothetical protein
VSIAPHPWWIILQMWAFPHAALALFPPLIAAGRASRWRLTVRQFAILIACVGVLLWATRDGLALGLRYWGLWGLLMRWWEWSRWSAGVTLGMSAALTWFFGGWLVALRRRGTTPNHDGLESAKPDLQSRFKTPGRDAAEPGIRGMLRPARCSARFRREGRRAGGAAPNHAETRQEGRRRASRVSALRNTAGSSPAPWWITGPTRRRPSRPRSPAPGSP